MYNKSDLFVVIYKILSYLYNCMKKGINADKKILNYDTLGINENYFYTILSDLQEHKYIKGVKNGDNFSFDKPSEYDYSKVMITLEGVEYLEIKLDNIKSYLADIRELYWYDKV